MPWQISHKLLFWRVWRFGNEDLGSSAQGHTTCPSRCLLHWMMWILWSARTNSQIINRSSGDNRVRSRLWSWGEGIAIVWWRGRGGGLLPIVFFQRSLLDFVYPTRSRRKYEISKEKKLFTYSDTAGPAHPPRRRPPVSYGPLLIVTLVVPAKIENKETLTLTLTARSVHK